MNHPEIKIYLFILKNPPPSPLPELLSPHNDRQDAFEQVVGHMVNSNKRVSASQQEPFLKTKQNKTSNKIKCICSSPW